MTIASQTSRISYTGDGSTTAFAVPFYFASNADLVVYLQDSVGTQTVQVLGTNYNLSGATLAAGGTCTFVTAPASGYLVTIYRDPAVTQTTSYNNNDPFPAKSHELALDKLTTIAQRVKDLVSRAIHQTEGEAAMTTVLASPAARKNKLLGFGSNGELIYPTGPTFVNSTSTGVADVDSRSTAQVTTFPVSTNIVRTSGLSTPGDGGSQVYKRGTGPNSFTDGGGVSWIPVAEKDVGSVVISTQAVAATIAFPSHIIYLATGGTSTVGDGGATTYKRGTGAGSFTDAGGVSWVPTQAAVITLAGYGAVGDGTTDNLTAINNAIAAAGYRGILELPKDSAGGVYHCSAVPTNPKGVYLRGPGYIQIPEEGSTGRLRRWDMRGESLPQVEGEEFLAIFHEVLRNGSVSGTKIEFLGDSTTVGSGITDTNYILPTLIQNNLLLHGFNCTFVNRAVSGTTSEDCRTAQIPASIANAPHLVIIRTGINDPYLRGSAPGVPHTEAQVQEVAELCRASLDSALSSYRASLAVTRTAIILMTPSVATLSKDGRDERYLEAISPIYRELARKYQCTFIDTYRIWRFGRGMNATFAVGVPWLDTPYGANDGGIHPLEPFNMQIADRITRVILPETFRRTMQATLPQLNTTLTYQNGWSNYTAQSFRARRRGQVVQLEGSIVPGTTTSGTTITTLPTNMRPVRNRYFGCVTNATNQVPALMYVDSSGNVNVQTWPSGATFASMEAINYIVGD